MNSTVIFHIEQSLKSRQMTQREFAALLGVSDVTVNRWLHAERNPSVTMIEKIARVLETSPSNLLSEDDGPYYEETEPEEEISERKSFRITSGFVVGIVEMAIQKGILSRTEKRQIIEAIENDDDEKFVRGGTRNVRIKKTVY